MAVSSKWLTSESRRIVERARVALHASLANDDDAADKRPHVFG